MPATIFTNTAAAIAALAGAAFASVASFDFEPAYGDGEVQQLTRAEIATSAWNAFGLADRDGDKMLDADEFSALSVVSAELAHLNGFISVETQGEVKTIAVPIEAPKAISAAEHVRIEAVSRNTFYAFAGKDGKLDADEYIGLQNALFEASDLNKNGALARRELSIYANRQAWLPTGA